jgi:hypothetical protein
MAGTRLDEPGHDAKGAAKAQSEAAAANLSLPIELSAKDC